MASQTWPSSFDLFYTESIYPKIVKESYVFKQSMASILAIIFCSGKAQFILRLQNQQEPLNLIIISLTMYS